MTQRRNIIIAGMGVVALGVALWWHANAILPWVAGGRLSSDIQEQVATENAIARSFLQRFPEARVYLSDYSSSDSSLKWNGIAGLHGRYILTLTVEVRLGRGMSRTITERGIDVVEVESVRGPPGGQITISYEDGHHRHASQWQAFVDSGGDLRALGFQDVKTDQPVPRFAEALQAH